MARFFDTSAPTGRGKLLWLGAAGAACAIGLFMIVTWHDSFFSLFPEQAHLVFHIFAEFTSIVLSFAIFAIGWYGYKQRSDTRNLTLALTFFAVGLLDFAHAFSFPEMPDFLTENSLDKATTFFVTARLLGVAGLLVVTLVPPRPPRWLKPYFLLTVIAGLVLATILIESYHPQVIPAVLTAEGNFTGFFMLAEGAEIVIAAAVIVILQGRQVFNRQSTLLLQVAMLVSIFSDLPFILITEPVIEGYFASHIFNAAAYYFVLRAIFVSALKQPYQELRKTREDLERSFGNIGAALTSSLELNKALSLITVLASDLLDSPHALVALKKEGEDSLVVHATRGIDNPPEEIRLEDNLAGLVWRTRKPVVIDDVLEPSHPYRSEIAAAAGLRSAVAAPVLKDDTILGGIAVYSKSKRSFDDSDARLLAAFARQAAVAIENARLFESELKSRERMEGYAAQLAVLHSISLRLNRETDTNRLLETVLRGAIQLTSAGVGLMTLIEDNRTEVVALQYADWYESRCNIEGDLEHLHSRIEQILSGHERGSLRVHDTTEAAQKLELPAGHLDLRGLVVGSIRDTRGRIKGHFMLSDKYGDSDFTIQDEEVISLLAAQSSVALVSAENFEREHYVAESLQSALLPPVPRREDMEIGILYRSAGPYGKVGGDFYDFLELGGSRIAVAVGDVCGKGIEAATYTAMIKYMLRAYLGEGYFPGDCLTRLNVNIASQLSAERFITACLAIIDTSSRVMIYSSAGHPPPVICRPGHASIVKTRSAVPLGVLPDQQYLSSQLPLDDVCQVILYSDGLIEARPEGGEPFGEARLAQEVTDTCKRPAQHVADDLAAAAVSYSESRLKDDIALLVVRLLQSQDS
ncbi:MAG: SpoIIE family protein phosphatase [Thermoleophilia bacterium]|nr:SpoIIE family protein phosphatase [Thermoleophilia bacterium]